MHEKNQCIHSKIKLCMNKMQGVHSKYAWKKWRMQIESQEFIPENKM